MKLHRKLDCKIGFKKLVFKNWFSKISFQKLIFKKYFQNFSFQLAAP